MNGGNNRAVTLQGIMHKILANILYVNLLNTELNPICHLLVLLRAHPVFHISRIRVKLVPHAEDIIGEYQGCFQRGRSTVDQIFTTKQILERCWKQNTDVHNLFIDL
jgi:hypothetical protein